ncbi:MAG TPA: acyltransferase [Mucilaginibacter sp.]|jgi:peptidoglycan/LPS O-acetylase OafA/YrhL
MEKIIPVTDSHHRYRQLDSLRGLGAITVFFAHYISLKVSLPLFHVVQPSPLGVLFNGAAALMLFFILSGFVLSLPFTDNNKPLKLTAFYTKRVFRIYPAYIFAIIFTVLLKELLFDRNGLIPYAGWLKNFWNWDWNEYTASEILKTLLLIGPDFKINFIDPPIWSLVIEMKMSIILPFFIVIVSRNSLALNIAFLLVMGWLTYEHNAWAISIFYLGVLMAKYKDYILSKIRSWQVTAVIAAVVVCILFYNNNYEFLYFIRQLNLKSKYILSDYLSAIGSCTIMMVILARKRLSHFFEHRIFTFFGDISYSFYLIHLPLLLTMGSLISNKFALSPVYIFLLAFALAVSVSYLMCVFIERPFQKFALRLVRKYKALNALTL